MTDYKKMYYTLFNQVTDVIIMQQKAQMLTEEMYISGTEPPPEQVLPVKNGVDAATEN